MRGPELPLVVDASVALKWVLPEADSVKAVRRRDEYKNIYREAYVHGYEKGYGR